MKKACLEAILFYLQSLSLDLQESSNADIKVQHKFVDKKWLGGVKSIDYMLEIGIHTTDAIVYVKESLLEQSSGFSFGSSIETYKQSGRKVYRKVQHHQFGIDGKAYDVNLDLGAILMEIEHIAKTHGFRFKEVITLEKIKEAHQLND